MPRLYILAGCNGAGKTTASYTLLPELFECHEFVNSDEFAKSLSPFDPSEASISASKYMLMRIQYLLQRYQDFSVETTLATRSLIGVIQQAKSQGYTITLLYLWLSSPEMAIERVKERVRTGGHNIPDDVVRRRYYRGLKYFFNTYRPVCDRWMMADNSTNPFTVIAEGFGQISYIKDNAKYRAIKAMVDENDSL